MAGRLRPQQPNPGTRCRKSSVLRTTWERKWKHGPFSYFFFFFLMKMKLRISWAKVSAKCNPHKVSRIWMYSSRIVYHLTNMYRAHTLGQTLLKVLGTQWWMKKIQVSWSLPACDRWTTNGCSPKPAKGDHGPCAGWDWMLWKRKGRQGNANMWPVTALMRSGTLRDCQRRWGSEAHEHLQGRVVQKARVCLGNSKEASLARTEWVPE